MKTLNIVRDFFLSLIVILIFTLAVVFAIAFLADEGHDTNVLGSIGGLLEGTLGPAVALAGAFVVIKIASLSYKIIDEQKQREDFVAIAQTMESGMKPIIRVARSLSELYACEIMAMDQKNAFIEAFLANRSDSPGKAGGGFSEPILTGAQAYLKRLGGTLFDLAQNIEKVGANPYATFIWHETVKDKRLLCDQLSLGNCEMKLSVLSDPYEIAGLIKYRAKQLLEQSSTRDFDRIIASRTFANIAKTSQNVDFDNISLRHFLELGAVVWMVQHENKKQWTNMGAAIIHDISCCIPESASDLERAFRAAFGGIVDPDLLKKIPLLAVASQLGSLKFYGGSFNFALEHCRRLEPQLIFNFEDDAPADFNKL